MNSVKRIAVSVAAVATTFGAGVVVAGGAAAAPPDCPIYDYRHGVSAGCGWGSQYVLEIDCFGIGRSTPEANDVHIFYHRTSGLPDPTGVAGVDCGQGSYIGIGLVTWAWIRWL